MKFANVEGIRMEAARGVFGYCQGCEQPVTPVCGQKRAHHWRHKSKFKCDHWWENETQWHRDWKNRFPKEWQEIRHKEMETGEWHIADVKTESRLILEFQHSFLKDDERAARNKFYGANLVWVVDGNRKLSDRAHFEKLVAVSTRIANDIELLKAPQEQLNGSLVDHWGNCKVPVFFDFGEENLWCLFPRSAKGNRYILLFSKNTLVSLLNGDTLSNKTFREVIDWFIVRIFTFENPNFVDEVRHSQYQQQQIAIPGRQALRPIIDFRVLQSLLRPRPSVRRRFRF